LSGCFATNGTNRVADGGAVYRYEKTADGACSVEITSSREVIGGAMFIGDDCTLQTQTESAGGGDALNIIGTLIEKIE
jgi:hypothetical protein